MRSARRFAFALPRFINVRIRSISDDSLKNSRMHSGDTRRNWPLPRQPTTSCAPPLCPRNATQMQTEPRLRRNSPIPASSNESRAGIAKHGNNACRTPDVRARTRSTASGRRCGHGLNPILGGHRSRCCLSFSSGVRDVTPTASYGPCSGGCANGGLRFWRLSMASGSNWIGSAWLPHLRATGAVEKAVAPRPWKALRVFHFPTATTAGIIPQIPHFRLGSNFGGRSGRRRFALPSSQ